MSATTRPPHAAEETSPAWHTLPLEEVVRRLETDRERGLSSAEAARRRRAHGPNVLAEAPGRSPWRILLAQFESLIVLLLVAATVVAFAMDEVLEAIAILVVIVLNALIGFVTEWKAERALTALREQAVPVAQAVRDGEERALPAAELVPGDVVILAAGARVPADGRLAEGVRLQVQEAALTGESQPVEKDVEAIPDERAPLGDRVNMAYLGTTVTDGRGLLVVTATGARTEVGRIGTLIEEAGAQETPLERKLAGLGRALVVIVLGLSAVIVLAGWLRGERFLYMLEVGISLAIAAVPEGLPAVATMTLALGMLRMARRRALIRRLPAVEALGATTVICTDKTGTLTRNEMTVRAFVLGGQQFEVTGVGYAPTGEFRADGQRLEPGSNEALTLALRIGALCNDARVERTDGKETVLGDPTEAALQVAAEKAGVDLDALERAYPRIAEVPFDSVSRRMVTVHRTPEGKTAAFVKGSPAVVLGASRDWLGPAGAAPLTDEDRKRVEGQNEALAGQALRVLGLGFRELPEGPSEDDPGRDLTFVGLVGMIDPLREEAKAAVAECREAGIEVKMITGDQQTTAAEIARQLGIDRDTRGAPRRVAHGRELATLNAPGWDRVAEEAAVFARVSPEHKLHIVEALQRRGQVVAMTGDGVNDAPALKKADVGVAMGVKGTEAAKEAADMVLTDDNFATLVGAVEQGRVIYANILRFIHYLFSCNFAEILVVFVAILLGMPLPLAALQILWLNVITDVFPALALALEPSAPDMMKRPPRDPQEPLLGLRFAGLIAWQGALLAGVTLLAFTVALGWHGRAAEGLTRATTVAFMTLALAQVFHAFNARSQRRSAFTVRLFTNAWLWAAVLLCLGLQGAAVWVPLLQDVLRTAPPGLADWGLIAGCALVPVASVELVKLATRPRKAP